MAFALPIKNDLLLSKPRAVPSIAAVNPFINNTDAFGAVNPTAAPVQAAPVLAPNPADVAAKLERDRIAAQNATRTANIASGRIAGDGRTFDETVIGGGYQSDANGGAGGFVKPASKTFNEHLNDTVRILGGAAGTLANPTGVLGADYNDLSAILNPVGQGIQGAIDEGLDQALPGGSGSRGPNIIPFVPGTGGDVNASDRIGFDPLTGLPTGGTAPAGPAPQAYAPPRAAPPTFGAPPGAPGTGAAPGAPGGGPDTVANDLRMLMGQGGNTGSAAPPGGPDSVSNDLRSILGRPGNSESAAPQLGADGVSNELRTLLGQPGNTASQAPQAGPDSISNDLRGLIDKPGTVESAAPPPAQRSDAVATNVNDYLAEERARSGASEAEALLNKSADRIQAQALGVAASARGGAGARERARSVALSTNAALGAQATQDVAALRAREDVSRRERINQLLGLSGTIAGQADSTQLGYAQDSTTRAVADQANETDLGGLLVNRQNQIDTTGLGYAQDASGRYIADQGNKVQLAGQLVDRQGQIDATALGYTQDASGRYIADQNASVQTAGQLVDRQNSMDATALGYTQDASGRYIADRNADVNLAGQLVDRQNSIDSTGLGYAQNATQQQANELRAWEAGLDADTRIALGNLDADVRWKIANLPPAQQATFLEQLRRDPLGTFIDTGAKVASLL